MQLFECKNVQELKAIVPNAILSTCLTEMTNSKKSKGNPFDEDSDEEDDGDDRQIEDEKDKAVKEPYSGSLCFKVGKNQGTNLYYVNHNKLTPMSFDERKEVANKLALVRAEEDALKSALKKTMDTTQQLLSEPTNEEATKRLETEEAEVLELTASLEAARKLKANEKLKVKTKRSIEYMGAQWRNRKRLCMDFLINLEENTDGSVQAKKCLSGDGQIALDSDENVAKAAVRMVKDKRARLALMNIRRSNGGAVGSGKKVGKLSSMSGGSTSRGGIGSTNNAASLADENFVAVNLDSQNAVCRVYVDEEE